MRCWGVCGIGSSPLNSWTFWTLGTGGEETTAEWVCRYTEAGEVRHLSSVLRPFQMSAIHCTDPVFHSLITSFLFERQNSVITHSIETENSCLCKFNTSFGKHNFHEGLLGCLRSSAENATYCNDMEQEYFIQVTFWSATNQNMTRNAWLKLSNKY